MRRKLSGLLGLVTMSGAGLLVAPPAASARKAHNGFWMNGFWMNSTVFNDSAPGDYLLGEAALNRTSLGGLHLGPMKKGGVPIEGVRLDGSELVGFTAVSDCSGAAAADERCFKVHGKHYQMHRGAWFVDATLEGSVVPIKINETSVCSEKVLSIAPRCGGNCNDALKPVRMRIVAHRRGAPATHVIVLEDRKGEGPHYACGMGENGPVGAILLQGRWNPFPNPRTGGARVSASANVVTFACENAVLGECAGPLGYKPWSHRYVQPHFDASANAPAVTPWVHANLEGAHQACTRLLRADYCGDGRSNTVIGTPIDIYDADEINSPEKTSTDALERDTEGKRTGALGQVTRRDPHPTRSKDAIIDEWEGAWDRHGILILDELRWKTVRGSAELEACAPARREPGLRGEKAADYLFPDLTKNISSWVPGETSPIANFHAQNCQSPVAFMSATAPSLQPVARLIDQATPEPQPDRKRGLNLAKKSGSPWTAHRADKDVEQFLDQARAQMLDQARSCLKDREVPASAGHGDGSMQLLSYRYSMAKRGPTEVVTGVAVLNSTVKDPSVKGCLVKALRSARWIPSLPQPEPSIAIDVLRLGELMGPPRYDLGHEVTVTSP